MKEIKIKLDDRELIIKKLPIGKYAELLKKLQNLPKNIQSLPSLDKDVIIERLPVLIASSEDDFYTIIEIATDLKRDEIVELSLNEVVDVVLGVIEVNKYKEIIDKIKKATAHRETKEVVM